MDERTAERDGAAFETKVERVSDREMVVTRRFDAPARIVFAAWTTADLMQRWWVPKSMPMTLVSCEVDARAGGGYRFVFAHLDFPEPMAFFGSYLEVVPHARLVWSNEESPEGAVTTLTFEERGGQTILTMREVYPTAAALDEALQGGAAALPEQFGQLDDLLLSLGEGAGQG